MNVWIFQMHNAMLWPRFRASALLLWVRNEDLSEDEFLISMSIKCWMSFKDSANKLKCCANSPSQSNRFMNDSFYELFSLFEHNLIRMMHHGGVSHDSFVAEALWAQRIKISREDFPREQLKATLKVVLCEIVSSRRKRKVISGIRRGGFCFTMSSLLSQLWLK